MRCDETLFLHNWIFNSSYVIKRHSVVLLVRSCSVHYCCSKYGFTVDDIPKVSGRSIVKHYIHRADPAVIVRVRMLLELIYSEWVILFESAGL